MVKMILLPCVIRIKYVMLRQIYITSQTHVNFPNSLKLVSTTSQKKVTFEPSSYALCIARNEYHTI